MSRLKTCGIVVPDTAAFEELKLINDPAPLNAQFPLKETVALLQNVEGKGISICMEVAFQEEPTPTAPKESMILGSTN